MPRKHLTSSELALADKLSKTKTPQEIIAKLNKGRQRCGVADVSSSAVYRFLKGETHQRDKVETRGMVSNFGLKELRVYDTVRKRLQDAAENEWHVTWEDVAEAGQKELRKKGLLKRNASGLSEDRLQKRMREDLDIRKRPAPEYAVRTEDEEKRRYRQALEWQTHPASFWQKSIHGYIDDKKFVCARTAAQRKRMRQARVYYHLRSAAERSEPGFVVPKKGRDLTGIPSVQVTACVAYDRIIMWRVADKKWCGEEAAAMYKDLGVALRRFWGKKRAYRVVEDGDPKGYQSNKGIAAKASEKIQPWKLPPRSPEWMPLDYSIWKEIEKRMLADDSVTGTESREEWLARLRRTAMGLPRDYVKSVLLKMKGNIEATVESQGKHHA